MEEWTRTLSCWCNNFGGGAAVDPSGKNVLPAAEAAEYPR